MKLYNVISDIEKICWSVPNVNSVIIGDVYDLNTNADVKYSAMVITEQNHTINEQYGTETFTINLFYVDRQTSDGDNILEVHSVAIESLKTVLEAIEDMGGNIIGEANINTFNERFLSLCSGAYVTVRLQFDIDDCSKPMLVTSVNGQTGDIIITTKGVTEEELNDRLTEYAKVTDVPSFLDIPTHTSQLTNDSGFLTETDLPIIPTKTSDLTNDSGFITRTDLPTKVSDLENNVGFITYDTLDGYYWSTLIPKFDEKADKTSLNSYALKSEIPTKVSQLENNVGYITIEDVPEQEEQIVYFYYSPTLNGSEILSLVNSGKKVILRDNMGWGADYFNFEFFAYSQKRMAGAPAIDYMYFMCLDGRSITWSGVNGEAGSWTTYYDENVHKTELPTKLSQLQNDRDYVSETEVDEILYPYAKKSELPVVPTLISAFENDANYITIEDIPTIPTKTSELTNDSGFLTEHQSLKTINNQSIVGTGNITIQGGGGDVYLSRDNRFTGRNTFTQEVNFNGVGTTDICYLVAADFKTTRTQSTQLYTGKIFYPKTSYSSYDVEQGVIKIGEDGTKVNSSGIYENGTLLSNKYAAKNSVPTFEFDSATGTLNIITQ